MEILKGIPVCPGVAISEAFVLDAESFVIPERFIPPERVDSEIVKFNNAVASATAGIAGLKEKLGGAGGSESPARSLSGQAVSLETPLPWPAVHPGLVARTCFVRRSRRARA